MSSGNDASRAPGVAATLPSAAPLAESAVAPERDPRATTTLLVALIGTILLLAVVLTALLLVQDAEWTRNQGAVDAPKNADLARIQMEQLAPISQYRVLDPSKGTVAVPIDEAIRLFLSDQKTAPAPATMSASGPSRAETQSGHAP